MASPTPPPWHTHLTLDTLLLALHRSLLHPFVASIFPLSLRALAAPLLSPSFLLSCLYAFTVSLCWILAGVNKRLAYGRAREVDWEDEVVVVTGGGRGLGRCVAEMLGMRGVGVAVLDLDWDGEGKGGEEGASVRVWKCDVGKREEVERVWGEVVRDLGTPTVLINNAAVVNAKPFLDLSVEDVEKTFRTNTLSHYHLTSLFLPPLLSRPAGGTLITISSVLGHLGASNLSAYTASKAALLAFHSSLTAELATSHPAIKTILVTPGQLDTGMFADVNMGWLRIFFGPVVEVRELAVRLVKMIDEGEGGLLALPAYARWIGCLGVLPVGVQQIVRRWSGVDEAMAAGGHSTENGLRGGGAKNEVEAERKVQ